MLYLKIMNQSTPTSTSNQLNIKKQFHNIFFMLSIIQNSIYVLYLQCIPV